MVIIVLACLQALLPEAAGLVLRTPDNNDTPGTATDISSGVPVIDSVNDTDDQYDFYRIGGVVAGQTIRAVISYTQPSTRLNLSIRNQSGNNITAVFSGGQTRGDTALASVNGTYYVEVKADTGTSDYTLNVTVALPPIIDSGAQLRGNLSAMAANRTDFYRFWLDGNISGRREVGYLNMTQSDPGARMGAAFLDILRFRGSHIYNESWNLSRKSNLSASAAYTGWYYCQVYAVSGASEYTLNHSRSQTSSDGDNGPANATSAPLDAVFNGRVNKAKDHYDWYSYQVMANDNLHINVDRGNSTDGYFVTAYDSNFTYVKGADNWDGGGTWDTITIDLTPILSDMTYFVAVEARTAYRPIPLLQWTDDESFLDYRLSFTSPDHPPQIISSFDNLTMNEDEHVRLIMSTHFRDPDGDRLNYSLSGAAHLFGTYICASGELEIFGAANWNGKETAYITADDGRGLRTAQVIFVTVLPLQDSPIVKKGIADIHMLQGGTDESVDLSAVFLDNDTAEGDVISYSVQDNGSILVTIQPSGKVRLDCLPSFNGQLTMQLLATDKASNTASCPCNVTVEPVNQPPFVKKGPPGVRLLEDQGIMLDLSQCFGDPEGDPITLIVSGNIRINVTTSGTNVTFQPMPDASGFTEFIKFTAQDDSGLGEAFVTVNVTVAPVNDAPAIGSFTPAGDVVIFENMSQQFSVSASDAENGAAVNHTWFLDGCQTLVGVTDLFFRTNFSSAGEHNVSIMIDDGELSVTKAWKVTVINVNRVPADPKMITPRPGESYRQGSSITFEGSAQDPDGDALTFKWYEGNAELGSGPTLSLVLPTGSHTVTLEISDGQSPVMTRPVSFTVRGNALPRMLSLEPTAGQRFDKGAMIRFSADFSDADGDLLSYRWTLGDRLLASSPSFNKSDLPAGIHVVKLAVSDGLAVVTTNLTVEVAQQGTLPSTLLIAGIGAGVLVVAVLVAILVRRRRIPPVAVPVDARLE